MSLWKRKDKVLIPAVSSLDDTSDTPSIISRSGTSPYRGGPPGSTSRLTGEDQNRADLFAGYNPTSAPAGRFFDHPSTGNNLPDEGADEDVEAVKQKTRVLKQDSVQSTRNALRLAREAEESGRRTLSKLEVQAEKLAAVERHLDVTKGHASRADDRIDELKQLNRSIFRPVIVFDKEGKRAAQEAAAKQRHEGDKRKRETSRRDFKESLDLDSSEGLRPGAGMLEKNHWKAYQFEGETSDDEMEDELYNNLDDISSAVRGLKAIGLAMNQELDQQNSQLDIIDAKTGEVDQELTLHTNRQFAAEKGELKV
ncbi:hypothetical protein HYDPIDRAFT_24064 [Hydnomerulius pinastri MD-312]|nr:hypothetical protein HYDPIDRAFT_24064 [Hydnomerulius pinastri MD-312]